jgi:hypothetical protein
MSEIGRHDPDSDRVFSFTKEGAGTMSDPIGPNLDLVERSRVE